ncbi:MAG: HAMP domain-containing protein [Rhizobiales bacterium]|nr:HAMP domain-containing protein [Hyphomicrobiales bacterium]
MMSSLKIQTKILLIASISLIGMIMIAALYLVDSVRLEEDARIATETAHRVHLEDAVRSASIELTALTSELTSFPSLESRANVLTMIEKINEITPQLAELPEHQKQLEMHAYHAQEIIETTVQIGLDENQGLIGQLRKAVHDIEDTLNGEIEGGLSLAPVMVQMLLLRRYEKDFMLRGTDKYVKRFDATLVDFNKAVTRSSLAGMNNSAQAERIHKQLENYKLGFHAYVTGHQQLKALLDIMALHGDAALQIFSEKREIDTGKLAEAERILAQDKVFFTRLLLGFIVLVAVVSVSLAILIGRSIARPVTELTSAMTQLANGVLDVDINGTNRSDELGEMARAVAVFQENAIKIQQMNSADKTRAQQDQTRAEAQNHLMASLAETVNAAVVGDFSKRVEEVFADEDLKNTARNVNILLETVELGISETGKVVSALANADLTVRMEGHYQGAFAKLKADTNLMADILTGIVGQLRVTSQGVKIATENLLHGAEDLNKRTVKQAATHEETSAAMEQLVTTVMENAKKADNASSNSRAASQVAADSGEVVSQANNAMQRITTSSAKISNIIGMIDDIAFQTNLLALNASVEAARAGEAGKGFAVVAIEVRRLAQSAAQASSEVKILIDQSSSEVEEGSKLVTQAAEKLTNMIDIIQDNSALIESIAAESRVQASAIDEVNTAVRQMDEMTQHNAALVKETNTAIAQTQAQANELDTIVEGFSINRNTDEYAGLLRQAG